MSLIELKNAVDDLNEADRVELSAYLIQLGRKNDSEWQQEIQKSITELEAGEGISESKLRDILSNNS